MQAILTKYLPATNTKGYRIRVSCHRGSMTVMIPPELDGEDCHTYAVNLLCQKFDKQDSEKYGSTINQWSKPKVCGQLPSGDYCHVFLNLKESMAAV